MFLNFILYISWLRSRNICDDNFKSFLYCPFGNIDDFILQLVRIAMKNNLSIVLYCNWFELQYKTSLSINSRLRHVLNRGLLTRPRRRWRQNQSLTSHPHPNNIDNFIKKSKFDAKLLFEASELCSDTFLHFEFPSKFSFPDWKKASWRKIQHTIKCTKTKFARFKKINFASNLHVFNEISNIT